MAMLTKTHHKFSKVANSGTCPQCGSTSIRAKRSLGGLLLLGLLARKTRVVCQGCGKNFRRG